MSDIEAVGEAVTGAIIARAVEPHGGTAEGGRSASCLNCGAGLIGPHCHRCGQAGHVHRTLTAWWHDLAHGVLHLDGKVWRTLPLLAWRPGELTRRYVEGERARFVSPMALFLFSMFLMFAIFSTIGGPIGASGGDGVVQIDSEADEERLRLTRRIDELSQRQAGLLDGRERRRIEAQIREAREDIAGINIATGESISAGGGALVISDESGNLDWVRKAYDKARQNPKLLAYKLQNNAYKFSWALIPISVPFVWLLFLWRRSYKVYDHTVFVTYSIAFMTLLVVTASIARAIGVDEGLAMSAIILIPPLHMYRQLRGAYRLTRFKALWRTLFLTIFAIVAGTLYFLLLLTLGVLG